MPDSRRDSPPHALASSDAQQPAAVGADAISREALIAGVAHELANALSSVAGWARVAEEQYGAGKDVGPALQNVRDASRAAERIARYFLALARGEHGPSEVPEPVNFGELARDVGRLLEPKARAAGVTVSVAGDPAWVMARSGEALSVVWNLIQNAVEASPKGGAVQVDVEAGGASMTLLVRDQGTGIPDAIKATVFDRFFTTKAAGTGLGLALVRECSERMGGQVSVGDAPGGGALFTVNLPSIQAPVSRDTRERVAAAEDRSPASPSAAGPLRILVVEDDEGIRELVETVLRGDGHLVCAASSAAGVPADDSTFDLAIVDVGLEGIRGDAIARDLRAANRVTHVVLASGASHALPEEELPDAWLPKPFDVADLRALVARFAGEDRTRVR